MASISVPCPKCFAAVPRNGAWSRGTNQAIAPPASISKPGAARFPRSLVSNPNNFPTVKAQIQQVAVESASNSSPLTSTKADPLSTKSTSSPSVAESSGPAATPDSILAFMAEAKNLVNFVDSKDIAELQLKKEDFELIIRKKEALPQPSFTNPPTMMPYPQAVFPYQPPVAQAAAPPPTSAAAPAATSSTLSLPPSANADKSSLPTLKSPMAGTFYRSPGPGEPPFINVGDKVQKGQAICIIEAMKLMNEIEAEESGTVVDILVENGKPVSLDTPLVRIKP